MKAKMLINPLLVGGLVAVGGAASAEDSVILNGTKYTCTTTCNVTTNSRGGWTVTDCCGGRVNWRILPTRPPED